LLRGEVKREKSWAGKSLESELEKKKKKKKNHSLGKGTGAKNPGARRKNEDGWGRVVNVQSGDEEGGGSLQVGNVPQRGGSKGGKMRVQGRALCSRW